MLKIVDENVFEIIRKMGFLPVYDRHGGIKVRLTHADDVRRLLNTLKDSGASFTGLDVRKPNLEEVFLRLTDETPLDDSVGIKVAR
jgi:ABC-2 type transport system ATP-binding protein